MKRKKPALTTTDRLVASLDVIRYELDRMNIAVIDAKQLTKSGRAALRREVAHLTRRTEKFLVWLSETRLE